MKLFLGIGAVLFIGVCLLADYKWKRWIAARRQERDHPFDRRA